ncbi:cupin domain-containing protein [Chondromyces crocatus]|uniref:Cupin type-2 domain-containing protein n=1 Tax=Chondromyces crocatus TaxID=52 RepID=A0A0K1EI93_CHOCO|nr:cupin domain-containing protein [Chondromyces crocatus]AKT40576.1 uncharacterized protein CMC5_047320 [Chondromyces crocatus]
MKISSRIALALALSLSAGCAAPLPPADAASSPPVASPPADAKPSTPPANGTAASSQVQVLMTHALPEGPMTEGRVLVVDFPPGAENHAHHHEGAVFAYVLEGTVVSALGDEPEVRYTQGQTWYENPRQVHRVSKNGSATARARLLVVYLTQPGAPVLVVEP